MSMEEQKDTLGKFPTFGSHVRWREEPPLPLKYSCNIEMPPTQIQMHLIDLFFQTRYQFLPVIPKRMFYDQLRFKGSLITPLLLNAIYCSVSGLSTLPNVPEPSVFYNRAKSLLDDFLDTPRVSTVAALCFLSLYEPAPTKTKPMADQHCRSWIYSGMGFRMCLELGLNIDSHHSRGDMSTEDVELRRRLFWACYCHDKLKSSVWERLWSLPSSSTNTALPKPLLDDDEKEQWIVTVFHQKIKLALIGEEGLQIRASFAMDDDATSREKYNEKLRQYQLNIFEWKNNLPSFNSWEFGQCNTVNDVMNEAKKSPMLAYLQIIYYYMQSDILFCLPFEASASLEHRIYAAQLTKCVESLCEQPATVVRYEFVAHALIAAIRVHALCLNHPDPEVEYQSLGFFNDSLNLLGKLQNYAVIPECSAILQRIPAICNVSQRLQHYDTTLSADTTALDSTLQREQLQNAEMSQLDSIENTKVLQQPSQKLCDNPYWVNPSTELSIGQVPMDNLQNASSFSSLNAFGSSIGVDFDDRRQLWQFATQDTTPLQHYEITSTPATPEESAHNYSPSAATTTGWSTPCSVTQQWPNPVIDPTHHSSIPLSELCHQQQCRSCDSSQQQHQQQLFIEPLLSFPSRSGIDHTHPSSFVQQQHLTNNSFQLSNHQNLTIIPSHSPYHFSSMPPSQLVDYPN